MAVKFSDFTSSGLNSTGFIVGYDSGTNQNIRIPKSTLDSTYQPTLISGTNIKTINGSSVLGSGDLIVSGGTGGGIQAPFQLGSGQIYSNIPIGANSSTAPFSTPNLILIMPFKPAQTFTTSNIFINVSVLGIGVNARILLYSHSATNGLPDTKIYESTNLDCSTTGVKTATTAQTFTAGTTYWLGVHASGAVTFTGVGVASLIQIGMDSSTNQYTAISRSVTFGSAPSPWGTTGNQISSNFPRIGLTIA